MQRFSITVLLLVGAVFVQSSHGWEDGKEYTYKIKSRTLASFNEYTKQFSGIVMTGQFIIQSSAPGILRAKIFHARYSPIHSKLDDGWESRIPEDNMTMQNFPISDKPFEIKIKRGVVKDLLVDKSLATWEVNILKSIVGQLQVDTQGENAEKLKNNQFPDDKQPHTTYKTMEDSVGGKCEVVYDISPLPAHTLQDKPELAPMPELRGDGDIISVVKSKNYTKCAQRVSFHFGVNGRNNWEPGSGKYLSRSSVSRIIISGDVRKYTIQSSVTSNKVIVNPDLGKDQQGTVSSKIELILHKINAIQDKISALSDIESTGNLVYDYNNPFEKESLRHSSHSNSDVKNDTNKEHWRDNDDLYEINTEAYSSEELDNDIQPEPTMTQPPQNPMLPFFIGDHGHSIRINEKLNVVKSAKSIAQEIGSDMVHPDVMPDEDTLEKFTILSRLVRLMNAEEIDEVQRELYRPPLSINEPDLGSQEQRVHRNTWMAFRDAVAQAGTGPSLLNIKKWVQEKKIKDDEAAKVIDAIAKSTRTPTPAYMETFFEMLKLNEVIDPPVVFDNAHQSYADLIRHAIVNKKSAHNRYPVHTFGKFYNKNIHNLHYKYFPYMVAQLQDGFERKDSIKIQVLISAIGRTGHPRIFSLFEPYIEGKKEASPYERFFMVISMDRLTSSYPKTVRSVLYKIYSNTADHYEIRTAAVYLLMKTNPPASMLQRMADFTNYDSSKQVNSAVKSSIESLAQLKDTEKQNLADAARTALPLLTRENYGPQYSRAVFSYNKDSISHSGHSLEAYYIGSDDSIIPKGVAITISPIQGGLKMPKIQVTGAVSKIRDLLDSLQKQLGLKDKNSLKAEQKKYSSENIAKILGINGDKAELLEGFMSFSDATDSVFFSYSDRQTGNSGEQLDNLVVDLPEKLRRLQKDLTKGVNYDKTSMLNSIVTMSFPTETGYPLTFDLKVPRISKVIGQCQAQIETDHENQSTEPKSVTITAKVSLTHGIKVQKRLSFVTPFENQQYIAGVDKSVQFHLPIEAEVEYNNKKKEFRLKIQPNNEEPNFKLVQTKIEPFTSKHDILDLKPVSTDKNTLVIEKENSPPLFVFSEDNKQSVQFHWKRPENILVTSETSALKEAIRDMAASNMARAVTSIYITSTKENTEYQSYWVKLSPSNNLSVEMKISYDHLFKDQDSFNEENEKPKGRAPRLEKNMNEVERKQKLLRDASRSINFAKADALDVSFKLNGELHTSANFTIAAAKSNVDGKTRTLVYAAAKVPNKDEYFLSARFESNSPNFKTMYYEETLKAITQHELDGQIKYGRRDNESSADIFYLNGKVRQTEERKDQIRQSRQAQECSKEANRSGNTLTAACQKANERASMFDAGDFIIAYENGSLVDTISMNAMNHAGYVSPMGIVINRYKKGEKSKVKIGFKVSPNDESVDFSITTPVGQITVSDVKMPHTHRSDDENTEFEKEKESFETVTVPISSCALDKTQVKTFDNHRFNTQLGQCWHVAMTPSPKNDYFNQGQHKNIPEDRHFTIVIRDNEHAHKDLIITLGDKEIELFSYGSRKIEVNVNGDKINISKNHSYQENKNQQIVIEIFELPDKSIKLVSKKYEIEVIYDGSRAIIKAGDKYRASVRGLCGDYDGESENDQKTPKGCLLEAPEEFSATYAFINDKHCLGPARENADKAKQSECVHENVQPGNVISDKEAGRKYRNSSDEIDSSSEDASCTERRTMVSRSASEICFSVQPVRTCMSGCYSTGQNNQDVAFHCVRRSRTSERIANRIEKGANPDLSQKKISKTENRMIPIGCRA
ncbi:vitellogenin-like [Phymastichus coffea]|uniref:vitellogenin-like n=1 Tax=Phymastichus coffea TaxID=108790 RepID=UPI00273BBED0|nr:vitellogenin-like [Phymastichus coffea]